MRTLIAMSCLALLLAACSGDGRAPATTSASPPPAQPAATTATTAATNVPASAVPVSPTESPPAAATDTPESTPTRTTITRPNPTSSGPLDVQVYVAGCQRAPTADKPGNVILTLSVEATGGNGRYQYVHQGTSEPDKFIDVEWDIGTRLIGEVTVTSGDGQTLTKEYDFKPADHCP